MTPPKRRQRKPLNQSETLTPAQQQFLSGEDSTSDDDQEHSPQAIPSKSVESHSKKRLSSSVISKLMNEAPEREPTVRLTVDLPESMHNKLSMLAARSRLKKAEIVRQLLKEELDKIDD